MPGPVGESDVPPRTLGVGHRARFVARLDEPTLRLRALSRSTSEEA